jgi:hypothetical protein
MKIVDTFINIDLTTLPFPDVINCDSVVDHIVLSKEDCEVILVICQSDLKYVLAIKAIRAYLIHTSYGPHGSHRPGLLLSKTLVEEVRKALGR